MSKMPAHPEADKPAFELSVIHRLFVCVDLCIYIVTVVDLILSYGLHYACLCKLETEATLNVSVLKVDLDNCSCITLVGDLVSSQRNCHCRTILMLVVPVD